jgi:3-isopropylmalate/(R)-2-methylmalate dehydratase small subunit
VKAFTRLTATALPIDTLNMDTDQLIPARLIRKPLDDNYHMYLFSDLRFNQDGSERLDFIYNQDPYRKARIIVGNRNFGCGSSREAAVFALVACDFCAVIAPSFGDIFFNNCFQNGVLPVRLDEETVARLRGQLKDRPGAEMTVDLEKLEIIGPDGTYYRFEVDPFRRHCLLNGLDDILLTLGHETEIAAFEDSYRREMSWLY